MVGTEAGGPERFVTGQIVSPYSKDFTHIWVSAILYDGEGEIIGGGRTTLDFIPANSRAAVKVPVDLAGVPATAELYGRIMLLSELE